MPELSHEQVDRLREIVCGPSAEGVYEEALMQRRAAEQTVEASKDIKCVGDDYHCALMLNQRKALTKAEVLIREAEKAIQDLGELIGRSSLRSSLEVED